MDTKIFILDSLCPVGHHGGMTPLEKDSSKGFNAEVAAVLRGERAIQRMTYEEIEERTGISRSTIIRVLNAKRMMDLSYLSSLCEALGLSIEKVIETASSRSKSKYGNPYGLKLITQSDMRLAAKNNPGPAADINEEDYL